MQNGDLRRLTQRLINNAIAFSQTYQCGELFLAGVCIQIEMQSNLFEPDGYIFGDAERPAKIEIALRTNGGVV